MSRTIAQFEVYLIEATDKGDRSGKARLRMNSYSAQVSNAGEVLLDVFRTPDKTGWLHMAEGGEVQISEGMRLKLTVDHSPV